MTKMNLYPGLQLAFSVIYRNLFKSLSSSFLKAVKNKEEEATEELKKGNPEDHARHEDYILSKVGEPLKSEVYAFVSGYVI